VAGGATVVLASHDLERAGALADRSVTLAGGRVAGPATGERTAMATVAGGPVGVA
jgi:ABC-type proline/glycine betaine transport system ATPase subunit